MHWADKLVKKIPDKRGRHRVDDMKTVSGMPHVGSLRAVCTHDVVFQAMKEAGFNVIFSYVFNDMDPMDGLPVYLDEAKYKPHMGKPLYKIPSPKKGYESFGKYYALMYKQAFNKIGCQPEIVWSHKLYQAGKMDKIVRLALDNASEIRAIYKKVAGQTKPLNWYPYQVICEQCGKVGTTIVTDWDGEHVSYECKKDLVSWAVGCGYKGKVKPAGDNGKLMWKVDWPAHWHVLGITVEGAGKDHFSEGGSRDVGAHICNEVFKTKPPFGFLHEFFLVRGGKMSSSKGTGIGADKITSIIPSHLVRFLIVKTPLRRAANFDPYGLTVLDLFDEHDKYADVYFKKGLKSDFGRIWQLSQITRIPKKKPFYPRFRDVANYIQLPSVDVKKKFAEVKGSRLTKAEAGILEERIKYAKIWLKNYAPKDLVYNVENKIPKEAKNMSAKQKKYLLKVNDLLDKKDWQPEELQQELFELTKKIGLKPKLGFQAIYLALTGKTYGPKAAWFLLDKDRGLVKKRFLDVQKIKEKAEEKEEVGKDKTSFEFKLLKRKDLFSINPEFKKAYPSAVIGLAVIKGVSIKKNNAGLQSEINEFIASQTGLTTSKIGNYPEIKSYRRIYKETGMDWHSKRPSPEALLRRVAQGKGLYTINACVDAYNLAVMKNRVSAGAFDLDQVRFPTVLRFAKKGDKITLLGDKKPTYYDEGSVAYFDKIGGYNIHFNYLDAERTKVTENTKNLWINVDGIFSIKRIQVERTLKDVLNLITKYCGGRVELAGIVQ
jgi:lysyl-tRNA synthetase, class I